MGRKRVPVLVAVRNSWRGVTSASRHERHFRIELMAALGALGLAFLLRVSWLEAALVVAMIGVVLGLELLNTAIEALADAVHPRRTAAIGVVKDVAAAAVLVAAMAAVIVGAMVFGPPLLIMFSDFSLFRLH